MATEVIKGAPKALGKESKIYSYILILDCHGNDKKSHRDKKG